MNTTFHPDTELSAWAHQHMPYAEFIGLQMGHDADGALLFALPFIRQNIGNVFLPALHGVLLRRLPEDGAMPKQQNQQTRTDGC